MGDGFHYVRSFAEPEAAGDRVWFAFRKRELLLGDDLTLPVGTRPPCLAARPVRAQFLGTLDGTPCYSAELPPDAEAPPGMAFHGLRQLYGLIPERLMALAGRAVQIVDWDRSHQFCGACGSPTERRAGNFSRICTSPDCRLEFFPRLSPAIIVAVQRGPEILLARSPHFPPEIYSVLAGFVDPGESLEEAVHREVREETGIEVSDLRYYGSQPWPFPNSLMIGFHAQYAGGEVRPDAVEIEDAAFFHVDALPKTFSGRASISQWLLDDFLQRHGRSRG